MILDEQNLFSDNQAITKSCESTNIIDFGKREISFGTPVELFIQVTEDFNNLTSLNIAVQTSEDEDFSDFENLIEQTMLLSELILGNVSNIKFLPKGNLGYLRLYYTVTGSNPTTGSILAGIADSAQESFHNAD